MKHDDPVKVGDVVRYGPDGAPGKVTRVDGDRVTVAWYGSTVGTHMRAYLVVQR